MNTDRLYFDLNTGLFVKRATPLRRPAPAAILADRLAGARALRKAHALAEKHPRIEIEKERPGSFWVTCEGMEGDSDPLDGNHFCSDGTEVLEAVQTYISHLTQA